MNMFKSTSAKTTQEYIDLIAEPRRMEIKKLHEFIQKCVPKLKPQMQSGMIGYGNYHYKYPSGREGDWSAVLLASHKNYISVYACGVKDGRYIAEVHKKDFPKASIGKSCIRFKKVNDIDLKVLAEIIKESEKFPMGAII